MAVDGHGHTVIHAAHVARNNDVGAACIDLEHGITTSTLDEAKLTRKMMKASSQNIVLADSSKFGQRGFGRICALEDIDVIITDDGIPEQMVTIVEEAGVDLIIVR